MREVLERLEEAPKGSYFERRTEIEPDVGDSVWVLVGYIQKPVKGVVKSVQRTYHGGHFHGDVDVKGRTFRVSTDVMFDHKPKRVKKTDEYGEVTVWE